MKNLVTLLAFCLLTTWPLAATSPNSRSFLSMSEESQIIINNRPLARVNGKTFSLMDVVTKMNIFLETNYPQIFEDKMALFQFYKNNWESQLKELVENELILADADEKIEVTEAEIRQEMQERYGTNMLAHLDALNMTLEDAKERIKNEVIIRKMTWFKAYSKAVQQITPGLIKESYQSHLSQFQGKENWIYDVLTLRGKNESAMEELANLAHTLLDESHLSLDDVVKQINSTAQEKQCDIIASVSLDNNGESKKIAQQHLDILSQLNIGAVSQPVKQGTRSGGMVQRIFKLKSHEKDVPEPFEKLASHFHDRLTEFQASKERSTYIENLKAKFHYAEDEEHFKLPDSYEPFILL
ncbi:MAG: hypothetical protein K9M07_01530 [Simkaniaceae bacterium]|nr:hypothetical protein [Simkaniaceae bacterium]